MMYSRFLAILITTSSMATATQAADVTGLDPLAAERFQIRARILDVAPDESSSVNVGGKARVDNAITPEVDLSYYFSNSISAELIAATSEHELSHNAAGKLGTAWILPPTLTLQYHPMPNNQFSPYVGAGLNYSLFYGEDSASGVTGLKVDGGVGYALQAGTDIWIDEHWGFNFDVKKIYLDVDAKMNLGATPVSADVDLDPWVIGAGVSYRF